MKVPPTPPKAELKLQETSRTPKAAAWLQETSRTPKAELGAAACRRARALFRVTDCRDYSENLLSMPPINQKNMDILQ